MRRLRGNHLLLVWGICALTLARGVTQSWVVSHVWLLCGTQHALSTRLFSWCLMWPNKRDPIIVGMLMNVMTLKLWQGYSKVVKGA